MTIGPSSLTWIGVGSIGLVLVTFWLWNSSSGKSKKKPVSIEWLDEDSYVSLIAICDTIFPTLTTSEATEDKLKEALTSMHPSFFEKFRKFYEQLLHSTKDSPQNLKKYLYTGALDFGTPKHVAEALQQFTTADDQFQLSLILKLLSTSLGCFILTGYFAPFSTLPYADRERILHGFRDSRIATFRTLFQVFKRVICVLYYSYAERGADNPNWSVLDYHPEKTVNSSLVNQKVEEEELNEDQILTQMICHDYTVKHLPASPNTTPDHDLLEVDAVIVGSGCGGGVMAEQLVLAGYTVLVLEKGGYFQPKDFARWRECEAMGNLYEKGGLRTSEDGSVIVLSGSCVGGGSTVNWSASFHPSETVLEDWAGAGLSQFKKGGEFEESLAFIHQRMNVNSDNSFYSAEEAASSPSSSSCGVPSSSSFAVNENNRLLWKSAASLGFSPEKIPRNVKSCVNCGSCCFGCSHRAKQSTIHTILEPLLIEQYHHRSTAATAREGRGRLFVIPDCRVQRVLYEEKRGDHQQQQQNKKATGVEAIVTIYGPPATAADLVRPVISTRPLTVKAKVTIVAAGSLYTPALLLASKFTHHKIGKYLTLHPVLGAAGIFPQVKTTLESGVSMGVVVKHPKINAAKRLTAGPDQAKALRHNVAIETPPLHLGIFGLLLPWQTGLQFKLISMLYPHYGVFIGITRDLPSLNNRIEIDGQGNPKIFYSLTSFDEKAVLTGLETEIRMLYSGGAEFVLIGHSSAPWFHCQAYPTKEENDAALEQYIASIWAEGIVTNKLTVYSAHQMSSCRMAAKTEEGPTSPTGELFECENLFVADGSVLPTSLGINPMITIEAMAHMISKQVITRLQSME